MNRLTSDDAIGGDLIEQYVQGRSRMWFWRQALLAIVIGTSHQVRGHSLLTLRSIVFGFAAWFVLATAFERLAMWTLPYVLEQPIRPTFWITLLTAGCPGVITGWLVVRLHRPNGIAFALLFAFVLPVILLPRLIFLSMNALEHERFVPYLVGYVYMILRAGPLMALSVLAGGILANAPNSKSSATHRV